MKNAVFFDIDGTIWDGKFEIPDSVGPAIRKLRENGNYAFLCSGRAMSNICSKELMDIGFDGTIAACGNHIEMNGEILYENSLTHDQVELIINVTKQCNMPVVLEGPFVHFISSSGFEDDPYVDLLFERLGDKAKYLDEYDGKEPINKFSADILPDTDYETIKKAVLPFMDIIMHEGNVIVEFIPKDTSKATGIKWICDKLGIERENIYAFGDSMNDISMLEYAGHSVCMGGGAAEAKRGSEYVTADLWADGIKKGLEHYGLI